MTTALGILILLGVAAGAVYVLFRPQWAIVLVLTLHPLKQLIQSYLPAFALNSSMFNFVVFGVVVLAVLARILRRDGAFTGYINPLSTCIWMLYGLALFGLLYTPAGGNAIAAVKLGVPYWLMTVLLLPMVLVTLDDFRKVLPAFMVIGAIISILYFVNPNASFHNARLTLNLGQAVGVADWRGSPLVTATMGAQVALVAVLLRPERPSLVFNLLRIAALIAGLGLAIASGSRGNVVIGVLVAVAFYPLARRVPDLKQFFLNVAGFGFLVFSMLMTFRFFLSRDVGQQQRWDISRWSAPIEDRFVMINSLLETYASSPTHWLFGLGTNAFSHINNIPNGYAHNIVFEILCEQGIVGLLLFFLAMFFTFRYGRRLWRTYADDPVRRAAVSVLLALATFMLLLYMKQSTFLIAPDVFMMWILLAKIAMYERQLDRQAALDAELYDEDAQDYAADDYPDGMYGEPEPAAY